MNELEKKPIWVVIPAYNEEKNIVSVITDLLKYDYQIVVVDDCSTDQTWSVLQNLPVIKLRHKINRGQGAALQTGTDYALRHQAETPLPARQVIVHFDGDGQFLTSEIERVVAPILSKEIDIVLGSRFLTINNKQLTRQSGGQAVNNKIPFLKKCIILPVARIINYFFTGLWLTDAHCGFRAMSRNAAEKIKITQDRMSHNTEIVTKIKKYNLKYKEIPVTVIYKEFGQGISGGFKILRELFIGKIVNK